MGKKRVAYIAGIENTHKISDDIFHSSMISALEKNKNFAKIQKEYDNKTRDAIRQIGSRGADAIFVSGDLESYADSGAESLLKKIPGRFFEYCVFSLISASNMGVKLSEQSALEPLARYLSDEVESRGYKSFGLVIGPRSVNPVKNYLETRHYNTDIVSTMPIIDSRHYFNKKDDESMKNLCRELDMAFLRIAHKAI